MPNFDVEYLHILHIKGKSETLLSGENHMDIMIFYKSRFKKNHVHCSIKKLLYF